MRAHLGAMVRWCRDAVARWWPTARLALLSYWTAGIAWAAMTALHGRWLWRSAHAGEVLSGYGAGLIMLGIFVASRPYIRLGVRGTAALGVQAPQFTPLLDSEGLIIRQAQQAYQTKIDAAVPDTWAERVIAVLVIVAGTLLNGYGTPLARRWGLPV